MNGHRFQIEYGASALEDLDGLPARECAQVLPASLLDLSNSRGLKSGLLSLSQSPRNSMGLRPRIQLLITAKGSCEFRYRARSVSAR